MAREQASDEGAASSVVAFLVAGVLFMASVTAVLVVTRNQSDQDSTGDVPEAAQFRVQSSALADILLSSPGHTEEGYANPDGSDWADGIVSSPSTPAADHVGRLGLLDPHASANNMLDFGKLQNLRRAPLAADDDDGFVNYEEAVEELGLAESGLDFHIRAYPVLPSFAEMDVTNSRDRNLRVTYIGDIDEVASEIVDPDDVPEDPAEGLEFGCLPDVAGGVASAFCASPDISCDIQGEAVPPGYPPVPWGSYRIGTWVFNGGEVDTQFSGTFLFDHDGPAHGTQDPSPQRANTWMVPAGQWVFLYADVPATDNFGGCDDNSEITVNVRDLGTVSLSSTSTPEELPPGAGEAPRDFWLDTFKPYFLNDEDPSELTAGCEDPVKLWYSGSHTGGGGNGANGADESDEFYTGNGQPFKNSYLYFKIESDDDILNPSAGIPPVLTQSFKHTSNDAGAAIHTGVDAQPNTNGFQMMSPICLPVGGYYATMVYCASTNTPCTDATANKARVTERILVHDSVIPPYTPPDTPPSIDPPNYDAEFSALREIEYLSQLVDNFCPYVYDVQDNDASDGVARGDVMGHEEVPAPTPTWNDRCSAYPEPAGRTGSVQSPVPSPTQYGDVFPDSTAVLDLELPKRLAYDPDNCDTVATPRYDMTNVLIVGSNVNQNAMTSPASKMCIANWIAGGGTLVVLGSEEQNASWLNEVIEAAITSSSGALATPDAAHPLLHVPQELQYPGYDNRDRVWTFTGATANTPNLFSHIVTQSALPVTTISNPGALTEGDLLLTTWTPYDVFDSLSHPNSYGEGLSLMHNLLMQSYRDLFLDYGPKIPPLTDVRPSAGHVAQVNHPDFANPVRLEIIVYVFKS